jgi:hypothetical protein
MLAAARSVSARVKLAVRLASVDTYLMEVAVEGAVVRKVLG